MSSHCVNCSNVAKYASTKFGEDTTVKFCAWHKPFQHRLVKPGIHCQIEGCSDPAMYADVKYRSTYYCQRHSKKAEVSPVVIRDNCKALDCKKKATFGLGGRPPTHCETHQKPYMVKLRYKCKESGCWNRARRQYCSEHSKPWLDNPIRPKIARGSRPKKIHRPGAPIPVAFS